MAGDNSLWFLIRGSVCSWTFGILRFFRLACTFQKSGSEMIWFLSIRSIESRKAYSLSRELRQNLLPKRMRLVTTTLSITQMAYSSSLVSNHWKRILRDFFSLFLTSVLKHYWRGFSRTTPTLEPLVVRKYKYFLHMFVHYISNRYWIQNNFRYIISHFSLEILQIQPTKLKLK